MDAGGVSPTTSVSSAMGSMSDSPGIVGMDSSSSMLTTFFSATDTPLFTATLTPTSPAGYAGLCIFLVLLATVTRCLIAVRTRLENHWLDRDRKRRYVVVRDQPTEAQRIMSSQDSREGALITANGSEEKVRIMVASSRPVTAWRLSVDLPRALLTTLIAGMGYLLMLAAMTYNIGYFLSVLGGIFVGDLAVGRFTGGMGEH